jgi:anthranilate phosphoribosyltransferase
VAVRRTKTTRKKDSRLKRVGVSGYNKPKRTPNHRTKSHVVVAKAGKRVKTIRFGQQGVSGAGKSPKSTAQKRRRASFKARHAKNIAKGKMSAAYWANKVKW